MCSCLVFLPFQLLVYLPFSFRGLLCFDSSVVFIQFRHFFSLSGAFILCFCCGWFLFSLAFSPAPGSLPERVCLCVLFAIWAIIFFFFFPFSLIVFVSVSLLAWFRPSRSHVSLRLSVICDVNCSFFCLALPLPKPVPVCSPSVASVGRFMFCCFMFDIRYCLGAVFLISLLFSFLFFSRFRVPSCRF
ncbi:hypothetical protein SAMN04488032_103265 [Pacificibacter marinus]|nr:hypothetical protein SAMN04488032_103265 [Pacificibacter marinus]